MAPPAKRRRPPPQAPVPVSVLDFDPESLRKEVERLGATGYRADQVRSWIYRHGVLDFDRMTNLPKALLEALAEALPADPFTLVSERLSRDGATRKLVLRTRDGELIETVVIPVEGRFTLCISSQAGCPLRCLPCATGRMGFARHLSRGEILGQILHGNQASGRKVHNVVFMGMGEPLLNFDNVVSALKAMVSSKELGFSPRRITLSTVGVVEGIRRLAQSPVHPNLAVSLHAPTQSKRVRIVPAARRWRLTDLLGAADAYADQTGRSVTYEYILIADVNASVSDAEQLGRLLQDRPAKVNLIPLNPVPGTGLTAPARDAIRRFREKLNRFGLTVTLRSERGADIAAACGQLAGSLQGQGNRAPARSGPGKGSKGRRRR